MADIVLSDVSRSYGSVPVLAAAVRRARRWRSSICCSTQAIGSR